MRLKFFLLCSFLTVFTLFMISWTHLVLALSESSISIDVNPGSPAPYQNTTITLSSFSANLDSVLISWFIDGKSSLSGIGKKSFSLTTKASNSETKVVVKIFLPDGEIDKNITIRPSTLVLLWQANDSYVPPFYKGKAMPITGSEIKIVAMPEIKIAGTLINPKNMTYNWTIDSNNSPADSGYGKNFLIYVNDYLENLSNVGVKASTVDQKYSSASNISVNTINPEIIFYRENSSLGTIWENALSDNYKIQGEEIITAMPYFISPKDLRRPELIFNWSINDRTINTYNKNLIPLKAQTGTTGTSKLRLNVENTSAIFQTANKEININF